MTVIAKFKCAICEKHRTYKVVRSEQFGARRVVCTACRKKFSRLAHDILLRESRYGKVEPIKTIHMGPVVAGEEQDPFLASLNI